MELLIDNVNKQKLINAYAYQVREDPTGKQVVEKYSHRARNYDKSEGDDITIAPVKSEHRWEATFSQQVSILTERAFKQSRKVILSEINIIQALVLTFVCCLIWYRIPYAEANLQDRIGNVSISKIYIYIYCF